MSTECLLPPTPLPKVSPPALLRSVKRVSVRSRISKRCHCCSLNLNSHCFHYCRRNRQPSIPGNSPQHRNSPASQKYQQHIYQPNFQVITVNSLMFAGINVCIFETKTMFAGINICGQPRSCYLSRYMIYVCVYLFLRFQRGRENRQINPSQTLMNLQYPCYR